MFRVAQLLGRRSRLAATLAKQANHLLTGADIAWDCVIGKGLVLHHPTGVVIGRGVLIGDYCRIQQGVTLGGSGGREDGSPEIGASVVLGAGSRVLGSITVGDQSIIGANAVVLKDVPAESIAVGVPAQSSRRRT